MQASKKNTYIIPEIVHIETEGTQSLPDRFRDAIGKYWLIGPSSLVYGDEEKANHFATTYHVNLSYGPVITRNLKSPPFCSKEQKVYLYGAEDYWGADYGYDQFGDPEWAPTYEMWQNGINGLVPSSGTPFNDYSFRIDTPLNQIERKIFGDMSAIGYVNVDFNYNFYLSKYEAAIQRVREELLPNLYSFISDDMSRNMHWLKTMKGKIANKKAIIKEKLAAGEGNESMLERILPMLYSKMKKKFMENFSIRFKNFIVPFENLQLLNQITKKWAFPMFVEIEFSTDSATEIAQVLEDASLSTSFQRHVAAGCGGNNLSLLNRIGGYMQEYYVAKENISYSEQNSGESGNTNTFQRKYKTLGLMKWWSNYLNGLIPKVYKNQTFVGPNTYSAYISSGAQNNNLAQALSLLVFSGKVRDVVKNHLRSYQEMIEGKPCHSETLLYRVAKYKGLPQNNQPIQNYWFPNSNKIDIINLVDTQVKYGSPYTYVIYAYQLAVGTQYSYGPITWDPPGENTEIIQTCPDIEFPTLRGFYCVDHPGGAAAMEQCVGQDFVSVFNTLQILGTDTTDVHSVARDIVTIYAFSTSDPFSTTPPLAALGEAAYTVMLSSFVKAQFGFEQVIFLQALGNAINNYNAGEIDSITYPPIEETITVPTGGFTAETTVMSYPIVKVVEVPFFSHTGYMVDSPPVPPNVNIISYRGNKEKILIWLNSSIGDYEMYPVTLTSEEENEIAKIRETQFLFPTEPIRYKTDDIATEFQIFRLSAKPETYQDFVTGGLGTISTLVDEEPERRSSSAAYVDTILPNQKYYYMFRAVDIHSHISNPTPVYEVELVDNDGAVYLLMSVVPMEEKLPPYKMAKEGKRYVYIKPRIAQGVFNPEASGLGPQSESVLEVSNYALGTAEENIWGKKYKVRFISKSTGRKMDLNIAYEKEHILTPEEAELRGIETLPDLEDPGEYLTQ